MRPNRSKKLKKTLTELKRSHGYHSPLQILFDQSCLALCEGSKMTIRIFNKTFGETHLFTTKCIFDKMFREKESASGHMDRYVDIRKCRHSHKKKDNRKDHNNEMDQVHLEEHDQKGSGNQNISVNETGSPNIKNEDKNILKIGFDQNSLQNEHKNSFGRIHCLHDKVSGTIRDMSKEKTKSPKKETSLIENKENLCVKDLLGHKNRNHYILACTRESRTKYKTMINVPLLVVYKGGMCEIDMCNFTNSEK